MLNHLYLNVLSLERQEEGKYIRGNSLKNINVSWYFFSYKEPEEEAPHRKKNSSIQEKREGEKKTQKTQLKQVSSHSTCEKWSLNSYKAKGVLTKQTRSPLLGRVNPAFQ